MATRSPFAEEAVAELVPGAYVTDGHHLLAILAVSAKGHREPLVTYEDCRTLELLVCPIGELSARGLELIRAGVVD